LPHYDGLDDGKDKLTNVTKQTRIRCKYYCHYKGKLTLKKKQTFSSFTNTKGASA